MPTKRWSENENLLITPSVKRKWKKVKRKWELTDHPLRALPHPDDVLRDGQVVGGTYPLNCVQETENLSENDNSGDDPKYSLFSGDIDRMSGWKLCAPSVRFLYTLFLLPQMPDVSHDDDDVDVDAWQKSRTMFTLWQKVF